jgi:hypothetical protein
MDTRVAVSLSTDLILCTSLNPTPALQLHHVELCAKSLASCFPDMASLEKLRILVIGDSHAVFQTYPADVAYTISNYCTPSFASVKCFRLDVEWYVHLPKPPEVPLLESEGFLYLGDVLHNPGIFPELKSVVLNFSPMPHASGRQETLQALQDEVQLEAKTVFCKVARRVEEFSVVSDCQAFR